MTSHSKQFHIYWKIFFHCCSLVDKIAGFFFLSFSLSIFTKNLFSTVKFDIWSRSRWKGSYITFHSIRKYNFCTKILIKLPPKYTTVGASLICPLLWFFLKPTWHSLPIPGAILKNHYVLCVVEQVHCIDFVHNLLNTEWQALPWKIDMYSENIIGWAHPSFWRLKVLVYSF